MNYLCLAAGKGSRFGQLGSYLQKCMYPVGLRPFVELSIANLLRSRAVDPARDQLTLVVGHHGEQLRRYFGERYDGLPLRYLEQTEALGTGHALRLFYDAVAPSTPTIVWLADLYVSVAMFDELCRHPSSNAETIATGHADENPKVRVSIGEDRVTRAWGGSSPYFDIGLWKLEPRVLAAMTEYTGDEIRALPNLQRCIDQGVSVGFVHADEWLHLGGTQPSPEANVRAVVARLLDLTSAETHSERSAP